MSDVNITPTGEAPEDSQGDETLLNLDDPLAAFSSVMDTLVPDENSEEAGESGEEAPPAPAGDGSPAPEDQGTPAEERPDPAQTAGVGGEPAVADTATDAPGFDAADLNSKWGELSSGLESRQREELEQESLNEIKEEHAKYFEALAKHPRELAGTKVPNLNGEGEETLRDAADAREWQDMLKKVLYREVQDRVSRKADDVKPMMETLHNSIAIFQGNPDLIPGSKQFDKELATQFAALAKPYELRVDDKLVGYQIPVQGMIDQIRQQLTTSRAAAPAAPAAPTAHQQKAAEQPRNTVGQFTTGTEDAPQAGIPSQSGQSADDGEDFSTLFGTIGLPNLRI